MGSKLPDEPSIGNERAKEAERSTDYVDPDWEQYQPGPLRPFVASVEHLFSWLRKDTEGGANAPPPPMMLVHWDPGYPTFASHEPAAMDVNWTWDPRSIPLGARVEAMKRLLWLLDLSDGPALHALLKASVRRKDLAELRAWIDGELAPRRAKRKQWAVDLLATLSKLIEANAEMHELHAAILDAVVDTDVVSIPRGPADETSEQKVTRISARITKFHRAIQDALSDQRGLRDEQNTEERAAKVLRAALRALGCPEREARTITRFAWKDDRG